MPFVHFPRQSVEPSACPAAPSIAWRPFLAIAFAWSAVQVCNAATLLHVEAYGREYRFDSADGVAIHPTATLQLRGAGFSGFYVPPSDEGPHWLVNALQFRILDVPDGTAGPSNKPTDITINFGAGESAQSGFRPLEVGDYPASDFSLCTLTALYNNCGATLSLHGVPTQGDRLATLPALREGVRPIIEPDPGLVESSTLDAAWMSEVLTIAHSPPVETLLPLTNGRFEILQADYGPSGEVVRFAVDFEQYNPAGDRIVVGQLRYNSNIPIPEPATLWLTLGSIAGIGVRQRRR